MLKLNLKKIKKASGITLVELVIAMAVFSILMAVFYASFSPTSKNVSDLAVKQEMTQKGQRVLDYVAEQLRLAGLFIAATPSIQFCTNINPNPINSLALTNTPPNAPPNESISYLTAERITTPNPGYPYLQTSQNASAGATLLNTNTNAPSINYTAGLTANAGAFITLDSLQPNLGTLVYQVTNFNGTAMTITPPLNQNVNADSNFYSVVMKQISVDGSRDLILTRWDNKAQGLCTPYSLPLISSHGPNNAMGGVDGFEIEFELAGGIPTPTIASTNIASVTEIRIWILLRSDFPASNGYVDSSTYTLGNANPITVGPFNDNYRRLLLNKSVEVMNVSF